MSLSWLIQAQSADEYLQHAYEIPEDLPLIPLPDESFVSKWQEAMANGKTCYIGMTDPSARKVIGSNQLSFSIPYSRFLEMQQEADGSFLTTDTWTIIKKRIP